MDMRTGWVKSVTLGVAAFVLAGSAQAAILYSAPPVGSSGFGWNSNTGAQQLVQEFTLGTGGTVDTISFFGFYQSNTPSIGSSFVLQFFADVAGTPSSSPFYSDTTGIAAGVDTGIDNDSGVDIFRWDFLVPSVALSGATQYWFGVKSNSSDLWVWSHSASDGTDNTWARFNDTDAFFNNSTGSRDNQAMEFAGNNVVPVPGTLPLIGLGLAGLGLSRRRSAR